MIMKPRPETPQYTKVER